MRRLYSHQTSDETKELHRVEKNLAALRRSFTIKQNEIVEQQQRKQDKYI